MIRCIDFKVIVGIGILFWCIGCMCIDSKFWKGINILFNINVSL